MEKDKLSITDMLKSERFCEFLSCLVADTSKCGVQLMVAQLLLHLISAAEFCDALLPGKIENGASEVADALDEEPQGYSAAFSQLANVARPDLDPCPQVSNVKQYLAHSLARLSQTVPGQVSTVMQRTLQTDMQEKLKGYLVAAGVSIM